MTIWLGSLMKKIKTSFFLNLKSLRKLSLLSVLLIFTQRLKFREYYISMFSQILDPPKYAKYRPLSPKKEKEKKKKNNKRKKIYNVYLILGCLFIWIFFQYWIEFELSKSKNQCPALCYQVLQAFTWLITSYMANIHQEQHSIRNM